MWLFIVRKVVMILIMVYMVFLSLGDGISFIVDFMGIDNNKISEYMMLFVNFILFIFKIGELV